MQVAAHTQHVFSLAWPARATRGTAYVGLALLLSAGAILLATSEWRSDEQVHTLLEVGGHLIALFVAAVAFVRYYTRPTANFLFVATAFLGTAMLDGYHAIVTTTYVSSPSMNEPLIPWSWLSSRMFLSSFLFLSYLAWRQQDKQERPFDWPPRAIYSLAAALTLASFLFFAFIQVPDAYFGSLPTPRPQDFLPAIFFLLALAGYLHKGYWRYDALEHSLVLSLIIGFFAQAAYMAWAGNNHDAMFDAAHVLKNLSYATVAVGLLTEAFVVYRREQQSANQIRRVNAQLSREIIERRRIENAREELEQQLRQVQKLEAIGQLAGGIAHDFNNILTAITGYVQLGLRRLDGHDPLAADLQNVLDCSDRGANLVQQLVAFSRRQTLRSRVLDLNPLLENASSLVGRLINADIELRISTTPGIGNIDADPNQIEQVLMNLVVNARDAMPRGGVLTLGTEMAQLDAAAAERLGAEGPGTYTVLFVTDTGVGMDEPTRERLFEPFFTTKEVGKGTGLGLATAYGIVKQHRGAIAVKSAPKDGTTFRIYLPCVDEQEAEAVEPAGAGSGAEQVGGPETVLLVEDEDTVRDVTVRFLEAHGYTVLTAAHPTKAERLYAEHHQDIELLITDIVMPGCNGRELYFRLNMQDPELKVLFMSGYADQVLGDEDAATLGEFFIQKPFAPTDLLARVRQLLDS